MPRNKVDGKITSAQAVMYCKVGTTKTNTINYGIKRKVTTEIKPIVKKANKFISNTPDGKFVDFKCNDPRVCVCPQNTQEDAEKILPVKVVSD